MPRTSRPQSYYDDIKTKFKEERDKRLTYRPPGTTQYTSELTGELEKCALCKSNSLFIWCCPERMPERMRGPFFVGTRCSTTTAAITIQSLM